MVSLNALRQKRQRSVIVAVVCLLSLSLFSSVRAQSPVLHVSSVKWTSTDPGMTEAKDFEVMCEDSTFESDWQLGPGLSEGDLLTSDVDYNSTTIGLEFQFDGLFTPISASNTNCIARITVDDTTFTVPTGDACTIAKSTLVADLGVESCCETEFSNGLSIFYCFVARTSPGFACTQDAECHLGSCRGGYCCGELGNVPGCSRCTQGDDGECEACASPYFLVQPSRRRRASVSNSDLFERDRPLQPDADDVTASPAPTSDFDIGSLAGGTCYRDQSPGATCTKNQQCTSHVCSGGYCCDDTLYSTACTNCTMTGECGGCSYGYELIGGKCFFLNEDGSACTENDDCATKVCRGGRCCGEKGSSAGCLACDHDGECDRCDEGYTNILSECFRDKSTSGNTKTGESSSVANSTIIAAALGGGIALIMVAIVIVRIISARNSEDE